MHDVPPNPERGEPSVEAPPRLGIGPRRVPGWGWLERLGTWRGFLGCLLAGLGGAWIYLDTFPPGGGRDGPRGEAKEEEIDTRQLAVWTRGEDFARLEEVAFSSPPESLYEVAGFLAEDHSPEALRLLKRFCSRWEGALVVAETAEGLPVEEALPLCRELLQNRRAEVRHGALCTLFFLAARPERFAGPWPEGMARVVGETMAMRRQWTEEQDQGGDEGFEEWRYKNAVAAFICKDEGEDRLGTLSEAALVRQLDGVLQKRFAFRLLP